MTNDLPLRSPPTAPCAPSPVAVPLAVDARGLAAMLSSSVRWVRTQDAAGKLPKPVRCAGRVLWLREEIENWLRAGAPNRDEWEARRKVGSRA